jgi:hypothetical protein
VNIRNKSLNSWKGKTKVGRTRCRLLTSFLYHRLIRTLQSLDISPNGIGAVRIDDFLKPASTTTPAGVGLDGNFFEPSSASLTWFAKANHSAVSIKGDHGDHDSTHVMGAALKNPSIKYWDLGAQVVHQHSDPDLSAGLAQIMFSNCNPNIECILFANHQLNGFDLSCITHVQLKALSVANSRIEDDTIDTMIPLLDRLRWLELSYNSITFRSPAFLIAAAASPTLKVLILSHNDIGDSNGRLLFESMYHSKSQISTLRLRNCFLRKHSSAALLALLASGAMFDELDLGGNEMFHVLQPDFNPVHRGRVEYLYIGGNGSKPPALFQLFQSISGLKFLDLDRTVFSVAVACGPHIIGILGLSLCFTRITSDSEILQLMQITGAHELWVVHSISQRILGRLLERFREIPLCLAIHIGTDLELPRHLTIPVIVETPTT